MNDNKTAYTGKNYPVHTNGPWEADATHCRTAIKPFPAGAVMNRCKGGASDMQAMQAHRPYKMGN